MYPRLLPLSTVSPMLVYKLCLHFVTSLPLHKYLLSHICVSDTLRDKGSSWAHKTDSLPASILSVMEGKINQASATRGINTMEEGWREAQMGTM